MKEEEKIRKLESELFIKLINGFHSIALDKSMTKNIDVWNLVSDIRAEYIKKLEEINV